MELTTNRLLFLLEYWNQSSTISYSYWNIGINHRPSLILTGILASTINHLFYLLQLQTIT
ncbi:hypothetical protein MAR_025419 [Mya arenaria]|uniref:Uncharacterized protein n=1 Tax=Mya arenaria TaxID=6604 RepID=A0ABY7DWR3_MYAAR|nr:hypothetical protein MAR_025419 [Mya arenaria]